MNNGWVLFELVLKDVTIWCQVDDTLEISLDPADEDLINLVLLEHGRVSHGRSYVVHAGVELLFD